MVLANQVRSEVGSFVFILLKNDGSPWVSVFFLKVYNDRHLADKRGRTQPRPNHSDQIGQIVFVNQKQTNVMFIYNKKKLSIDYLVGVVYSMCTWPLILRVWFLTGMKRRPGRHGNCCRVVVLSNMQRLSTWNFRVSVTAPAPKVWCAYAKTLFSVTIL